MGLQERLLLTFERGLAGWLVVSKPVLELTNLMAQHPHAHTTQDTPTNKYHGKPTVAPTIQAFDLTFAMPFDGCLLEHDARLCPSLLF